MDEVLVFCTDRNKYVPGFILRHKLDTFVDISINTVKVHLVYSPRAEEYVGSFSGLEWILKKSEIPDDYADYRFK